MAFPKTYRTNLGWAMCVGAIIALLGGKAIIVKPAIVALVLFGAIGATWSAWEHKWLKHRRRAIGIFALIWMSMALIGWWVRPETPANSTEIIETWKRGAKIEWGPIRDISAPNNGVPFFINFYSPNTGQLDALNVRRSYSWRMTEREGEALSPEDIDKGFAYDKAGFMFPVSAEVLDRISAGDKTTWFTANNKFVSTDDFAKIQQGTRRLYLMAMSEYKDSETPKGRATFTEFCVYFEKSFSFYHFCDAHNAIYTGPIITNLKQHPES